MAILAWAAPNTALPKTTRELTMGGIPTLATSGFQVAKPKSFAWWLLWLIILLESLHPPPSESGAVPWTVCHPGRPLLSS